MTNNIFKMIPEVFKNELEKHFKNKHSILKTSNIKYKIELNTTNITINLAQDSFTYSIIIPVVYYKHGVEFIKINGTVRPTCSYYIKSIDTHVNYTALMYNLLINTSVAIYTDVTGCVVNRLASASKQGVLARIVHKIQLELNEFTNKLPLHTTNFNSYGVNNRVTIIDPAFDCITDPIKKHKYQVEKNKTLFEKYGWTSRGLSDGTLAGKNYMMCLDLSVYTPFGLFHNPQRNLYSTLGMKGDEKPLINTVSAKDLETKGIYRTGWNLTTLFVDIPDVWEDQLIVNSKHKDKFITYSKVYTCFNKVKVSTNQIIYKGTVLASTHKDKEVFDIVCDHAYVNSIKPTKVQVGVSIVDATEIEIKYIRHLKEGAKLTNTAANKGIIRFMDIGYAINPVTKEHIDIDIICSSKAVMKRKNYSQIIEALINTINDNKPIVVKDDAKVTLESLSDSLVEKGYNSDGTLDCNLYCGKFKGIVGKVFWGLTHDADDTIWENNKQTITDSNGLRISGLKFSSIEMSALKTRFGNRNPILDEIMSYSQGHLLIDKYLTTLKSFINVLPSNINTYYPEELNTIPKEAGSIINKGYIKDTIFDEDLKIEDFVLQLPVQYQVSFTQEGDIKYRGALCNKVVEDCHTVILDKLFIPGYYVIKCWTHASGYKGLSGIGTIVNNLLNLCKEYKITKNDKIYSLIYKLINNYIDFITNSLTTKKGFISRLGMSVRYPNSVKGVATLSNDLPKNTVEIHTTLAAKLGVIPGDIVLVERFPCLGFMSLRPQQVYVTDDPNCRYTIRVSGNSLGSASLDFDGDILYCASFKTKKAQELLKKEWSNPNKDCFKLIEQLNNKMGKPIYREMCLKDYKIKPFSELTTDQHAKIIDKVTGVKSSVGPVVAFVYNIQRIVESTNDETTSFRAGVEIFLDKVANSIFKQKHGVVSLHQVVVDALCTGDVETLVKHDFPKDISEKICNIIKEKSKDLNIPSLQIYHDLVKKKGYSNVINLIVRKQHSIYFASRAQLNSVSLLFALTNPVKDMPSKVWKTYRSKNIK